MISTRRQLLTGFVSLLAAPAIVRVSSLMPISVQPAPEEWHYIECSGSLNFLRDYTHYMAVYGSAIVEMDAITGMRLIHPKDFLV